MFFNKKYLPIKGYENLYLINELGEIYSLKNKIILKQYTFKSGYKRVGLSSKHFYVHRLVANTFLKKIKGYNQVNHIDGNKGNNNLNNLEWVNAKKNSEHAIKLGLTNKKGEKCNFSKLKTIDILKIKKLLKIGIKQNVIAKKFKVSRAHISLLKNNLIWKHLN